MPLSIRMPGPHPGAEIRSRAFARRSPIAAEPVAAASRTGGIGRFITDRRNAVEIRDILATLPAAIANGLVAAGVACATPERRTARHRSLQR